MQTYLEAEVKSFIRKARQLSLSLSEVVKLVEDNYHKAAAPSVRPDSGREPVSKQMDSRLSRKDDNNKEK